MTNSKLKILMLTGIIGTIILFLAFIPLTDDKNKTNNEINSQINNIANNTNPIEVKKIPVAEVAYVYQSKEFEGDAKNQSDSLKITEQYIDTDNHCDFCTLVEYTPKSEGIAGMAYFDEKGFDLTKAKKVTFYVMGLSGDATVKFMVGGKKINEANSNSSSIFLEKEFAQTSKNIKLINDWRKIEIDVSNSDLKDITHPFAFEIKTNGTEKVSFYMKHILYES